MIKAYAKAADGQDLLIIGLSFGNLDKFRAQPGDTYIKIDGREMEMPIDVMLFSCETEAAGAKMIEEFIGAKTKVTISDKLKS